MRLTLTDDDGVIIAQWNVEEEFGDLTKPLPRAELTAEVCSFIAEAKQRAECGKGA